MERLTLPAGSAAAVDEYMEYRRYKQHKTDFETIPQQRPISLPCQVTGCPCRAYLYVPLNGRQPIRCRCKHFADQHSAGPGFMCNACSQCSGFHSSFTCACGQPAYAHYTVVETKEERLAQRKPVGRDVPYAAMGGLTGFSSLAEDYMRLDDSGIGAPSGEFLDSPVTAMDHPFLKAFQASSSSSPETLTDVGTSSQVSSLRKPEEDDMAFFERRYQERVLMKSALSLREKKRGNTGGRGVGSLHTPTNHILKMQLGPFNNQIVALVFSSLITARCVKWL
ncbi:protein FAM221A isoform X7 [Lagenorhynchus albirostris]|uniref:protein FAM221A isoform X7 n=1 Tax=Lagenorhynchus albirostris TaxID=27610 RepID=UPI0028E2A32F|nr:protein FAM221A isoform X7 [Lagenorhynchus albirostris]